MKLSSLLLAASLAANVALVTVFVAGATQRPARVVENSAKAPAPAAAAPDAAGLAAGTWTELHADDPRQQAEKLRADGFPPRVVRAIISAQIRAGFAARRKAIEAAQADQPFWKGTSADPATQAAMRALVRDEQKAIKDILGPDPENGPAATLRRQFPNFSADTIEQIAAIRERYDLQRSDLYANIRGSMLPDEQAKIEALDKAMRGEFAAVLTPQELEDYDLRTSNTANQLRYTLVAFDATEQEFRTLYALQKTFDERYGRMRGGMSEEETRGRSEGQKQLTADIKAALGEQRFAEYQRATDYNYQQTAQLVARLNLPRETANALYTVQKEFEQRRNDLYRAGGVPGAGMEGVTTAAKALQQEAVGRITSILGNAKTVDDYKQYGGSWIESLVPRPPVRPPAPKS